MSIQPSDASGSGSLSSPRLSGPAAEPVSLIDVLRRRGLEHPDRPAYSFLSEREGDSGVTYRELERRSLALAARLQSRGLERERALLLFPPGLDFVTGFFGCLCAGTVAVPAYPPQARRIHSRLDSIFRDSRPKAVVTTAEIRSKVPLLAEQMPELAAVEWIAADEIEDGLADAWTPPRLDGDSLALLQYTSGSTSSPKGVMVSHGNLLHNERLIREAFGQAESSVVVGWLPLYHDMGLIGNVLQPLYAGARCVLMAPAAFLQNPLRWLAAISRYRATTSGGPDFAYDLCARRITEEQKAELDLSSWRVAFNGAEPVRAATLARFAEAFASCGFDAAAFHPCYGLAEATLVVSAGRAGTGSPPVCRLDAAALEEGRVEPVSPISPEENRRTRTLVSCGRALLDVAVVEPESSPGVPGISCPPGRIGEIWVAGACIAAGYWERPEETAAAFGARLAGGTGPYLRTGDLGFVQDGELFVTGRLKDLVILRGRNHYPQDLERTAEASHPELRPGGGAAFSIEDGGEERLVLVLERTRKGQAPVEEAAAAVRRALAAEHGVTPFDVVLIRPETLPRTTSGKVRRRACRDAYVSGGLAELGRSALAIPTDGAAGPAAAGLSREALLALGPEDSRPVLIEALRRLAATVLGTGRRTGPERIDPQASLGSLGLDSLAAAELRNALEAGFGTAPDAVELLAGMSLDQLAGQILESLAEPAGQASPVLPCTGQGPVPASLEQERLWFLDQLRPGDPAANIPLSVQCDGPLDRGRLATALAAVMARHESLRTCFGVVDGRPVQAVLPPGASGESAPACADLSGLPAPRPAAEAARLAEAEALRPFDLARGPLLRAALIRLGAAEHRLLLTVHHAVCDLGSLLLAVEDLARAYAGDSLPGPPLRFADFAVWQRQRLALGALEHHLSWWREQLAEPPDLELPADRPRPDGGRGTGDSIPFAVPVELEAALRELAQAEGATLFMILLATFSALLHRVSGEDDLVIGCPVAGRPRPELQELVGFFAYPLPLRLDLAGAPTFRELLARVRGRVLAALLHQEAPFARVVAAARRAGRSGRQAPPFRVMLSLLDRPLRAFGLPGGLRMTAGIPALAATDFDLFLTLVRSGEGLSGLLQYNRSLFTAETARLWVESLLALAAATADTAGAAGPDSLIGALPVAPALLARAEAARERAGVRSLAVAATFTAEPVAEPLDFWMGELGFPARVRFAPFGQVFQALLDPAGLFARNRRGANVVLVRFEDWERADADELALALREAGARHAVPCLAVICPPSPAVRADAARSALHAGLEERLAAAVAGAPGVLLATSGELAALYPVAAADDPHADEIGRVPYTPELFAALGTLIARKLNALWSRPAKVLVLDCDQTLWKGVCAEDGPLGVEIDPPRRRLQELALARRSAGTVLCLCSKNREEDVREVFARRPDMPLAWEDFAAWRINWEPKSSNLRGLAAELRLGLDSFVVLDDDPVACAEMEAGCPEALVLRLPQDPADLPRFLDHAWVFDAAPATAEDLERAAFYGAEAGREGLRRAAPTLADFLAGLEIEVRFSDISDLDAEGLARAAQLTQRTNQWNATSVRRTEGEIREFLRRGGEGLLVDVRDRFGEYGQVGLALWRTAGGTLAVDTLLLSCRALGRGVEHRLLAKLGQTALSRFEATVEVPFRPTARNRPASDFLNAAGAAFREAAGDGLLYRFPAAVAAALELRFDEAPAMAPEVEEKASSRAGAPLLPLRRIPTELATAGQVLAALRARRGGIGGLAAGVLPGGSTAPRTPAEEKVAEIWRDLLGVERIGVDDHFFDLGGHSLLATQVISRVREAFGVEVPLAALFEEAPTVANLARAIARYQVEQADEGEIAAALAELDELSEEEIRLLLMSEE
jgi:FkbH-like protein